MYRWSLHRNIQPDEDKMSQTRGDWIWKAYFDDDIARVHLGERDSGFIYDFYSTNLYVDALERRASDEMFTIHGE